MSMRFMDSFDHYSFSDPVNNNSLTLKWNYVYTTIGFYIGVNCGRYLNSLRFYANGNFSAGNYIYKTLDNQATWFVGFAFKCNLINNSSGNGTIFSLYDSGTTQVDLRLNTDGTLTVTRNGTALTNTNNSTTKSTNALSTNTWYYIEFMCTIASSISSNSCKVNVNGTNTGWINLTSAQSTKNTGNATANQICLGCSTSGYSASSNPILDYDDLYVCDSSGSTNNAFLGDTRIEARFPTANGTTQNWSGSFGYVDDLAPDGDASYISSGTTNDISTFTIQPTAYTPSSIFAMQMIHYSRKTDAGNRQIADELRSGSTNFAGTTVNLGTSYQYFLTIYETDPNTSAAWTGSAANAVEIGVKQIT